MEYLFDDIVFNTKTDTLLKKENFLQIKSGEISEYLIKLKFDGEVLPSTFRITFRENLIDEFGFFSSTSGG